MPPEYRAKIDATLFSLCQGCAGDDCASHLSRAIGPVCPDRRQPGIGNPVKAERGCSGEFLRPSSFPSPRHRDGRLTSGNDTDRAHRFLSSRDIGLGKADKPMRRFLRLSHQGRPRENSPKTCRLSGAGDSAEHAAVVADDVMLHAEESLRAGFQCFRSAPLPPCQQVTAYRLRNGRPQSIPTQYVDRISECCRIGSRRTGADCAEVIADNIRKDERDDRCVCGNSEAAALQQGEMFSDCIDLLDGCAAPEQQACRSLRIGQG